MLLTKSNTSNLTIAACSATILLVIYNFTNLAKQKNALKKNEPEQDDDESLSLLPCIKNRRSLFPNTYKKNQPPIDKAIVQTLIDAALYGPFHGKRYKENKHPARFVILGKKSMVEMQHLTLKYYDDHWKENWENRESYQAWRSVTEEEITGRWGPVSYMIGIIMRRQAGPKRFPEWEEMAAVGAAVQNMHLQSSKYKHLACYWSSWHCAARDSDDMKSFLGGMEDEDKCMGFFIVAQAKNPDFMPVRKRDQSLLSVEWRD